MKFFLYIKIEEWRNKNSNNNMKQPKKISFNKIMKLYKFCVIKV